MYNIEKSALKKGEYVGYSHGVWRITKSTSSYGRWCARRYINPNDMLFAWRLSDLSAKLEQFQPQEHS